MKAGASFEQAKADSREPDDIRGGRGVWARGRGVLTFKLHTFFFHIAASAGQTPPGGAAGIFEIAGA